MTVVESRMKLRILVPEVHAGHEVVGAFRYQPSDPYAVELTFVGYPGLLWVFGRELLADGMRALSGLGDVKVWPSVSKRGAVVVVGLSSPDGRTVFAASRRTVSRFLDRAFAAVPAGRESKHVDVDGALAGWFTGTDAVGGDWL